MSLVCFAIFWFRSLKSLRSKGISPGNRQNGMSGFRAQIGHFRGGLGSAGPIFANSRHFSATNIGGYLLITREWFLNFLSLFDNLPFRRRKTRARAPRKDCDAKRTKKMDKNGPKTPHSPSRFMPRAKGPGRRTPFVIGNSARLALGRPKRPGGLR